ncbi:MAG TPA: hypothetical protein VIO94_16050 [Phenylobacterium sp.]
MHPRTELDPELRQFAQSDRQREVFDAVVAHGGMRPAAAALGVAKNAVNQIIHGIRKRAAVQGYAPEFGLSHRIPAPFVARGHSTLDRIKEGEREQVLQWTKTRLDDQQYMEMVRDAVEAFVQGAPPIVAAPAPSDYDTDIIPFINIGDAHLGMLAHEAETGENFDLKIAERELCAGIALLIDQLGPHERCVINDLGDFTHYENFTATTEASGHALDYDSRFPRMIAVYSRMMRFIVEKALSRFKFVDVIINQGNHSRTNDIWMAELLRVAFGHTGRVNVLNNDSVFIGYRMGKTFVMTHHSDKCRPADLIGVMITDYREDFGETEHHYIDIGHIHHRMAAKEHPSVTIESWNQLAAGDKYAHDKGYRSRQSITAVLRSRKYGEVGRRTLPVQQIRDSIMASMEGVGVHYQPSRKLAFVA